MQFSFEKLSTHAYSNDELAIVDRPDDSDAVVSIRSITATFRKPPGGGGPRLLIQHAQPAASQRLAATHCLRTLLVHL